MAGSLALFLSLSSVLSWKFSESDYLEVPSESEPVHQVELLKEAIALSQPFVLDSGNRVYGIAPGPRVLKVIDSGQLRNLADIPAPVVTFDSSDDGSRVLALVGEQGSDEAKVYLWEEGFQAEEVFSGKLPQPHEIDLSPAGNRGFFGGYLLKIFSGNSQGLLRNAAGGTLTPRGETSYRPSWSLEKVHELAHSPQVSKLTNSALKQLSWQTDGTYKLQTSGFAPRAPKYDFDGDGADDFLIFGAGRQYPYFQAYTSSGTDGATKNPAGRGGYRANWRFGDNEGIPFSGDFDGDGYTDIGTYTPSYFIERTTGDANWQIYLSGGSPLMSQERRPRKMFQKNWGLGHNRIVPADYDGDGKTDLGVFNPIDGHWSILLSKGGFNRGRALQRGTSNLRGVDPGEGYGLGFVLGKDGLPLPGDYDGNGVDDLCTYQESGQSIWSIKFLEKDGFSKKPDRFIYFGKLGDVPISGDFNCNGKTDLAVWRPSSGQWLFRFGSKDIKAVSWRPQTSGTLEPISGDFDGDSCTDIGFISLRDGEVPQWFVLPSSLSGGAREVLGELRNTVLKASFGRPEDKPVDYLLRSHQRKPGHDFNQFK